MDMNQGKQYTKLVQTKHQSKLHYLYLLVCALWLVNLAGRTLLYGPLKFKVDSVAKLFCDLSPTVLNFYSK